MAKKRTLDNISNRYKGALRNEEGKIVRNSDDIAIELKKEYLEDASEWLDSQHEEPQNFTQGVKGVFDTLYHALDVLFEYFRNPDVADEKAKLLFPTKDGERVENQKNPEEKSTETTTDNYEKMLEEEGPGNTPARSRHARSTSDPTAASRGGRSAFNKAAPVTEAPDQSAAPANTPAPTTPTTPGG